MAATYRRGGFGYGEVKKALADLAGELFCRGPRAPPRTGCPAGEGLEILGDGAATAEEGGRGAPAAQRACGVKP